jgi:hypothetical protein
VIGWLYEKTTGTPWTTTRSMAAEFGPPPAVQFSNELLRLTDDELLLYGDQVLAGARRARAAQGAMAVRR